MSRGYSPWEVPVDVTGIDGFSWFEGEVLSSRSPSEEVGPGSLWACDWNDSQRSVGRARTFIKLLEGIVEEYSPSSEPKGVVCPD